MTIFEPSGRYIEKLGIKLDAPLQTTLQHLEVMFSIFFIVAHFFKHFALATDADLRSCAGGHLVDGRRGEGHGPVGGEQTLPHEVKVS